MKYIDMHCDTLSKLIGKKETGLVTNGLCVDISRLKEAGASQFFACYINAADFCGQGSPWDQGYEKVLSMAAYAHRAENPDFGIARSAEDILKLESQGRSAGILTVEEGGVLNGRMERLDQLFRAGIRLVTLTWNYVNCIGSPASRERSVMEAGLTPFGMEVVERMNELGMIVDVSHLSDGGFWDCIRHAGKPVAASHSNARSLCSHPRNLSDRMLRALGEKGGVAGVNFYGAFLKSAGQKSGKDREKTGRAGVNDIVRHIKWIMDKAGEDAVALGTDFDGFGREYLPSGINGVQDMEVLWEAMKRAEITERQIEKAAYQNVMRVLRECTG